MNRISRACCLFCLTAPLFFAGGCIFGKPNKANIDLRKKVQELEGRAETLKRQHDADQETIAAYRRAGASTSQPSLPPDRLAQLFTTTGLKFGRLTGGHDVDPDKPGDEGMKVYLVPTDAAGEPIKAAGSFTIDAFDLDNPQSPWLGTWKFDVDEAKRNWYGSLLSYTYAFTLPWQTIPTHDEITVKGRFVDALTGLTFESQTKVKVKLPATTRP